MSRVFGFSFSVVLAMAIGLTGMIAPQSASAANWYVDDDCGPVQDGQPLTPFCDIQDGIDAAADGDTVFVDQGTYTGPDNRYLTWDGTPDRDIRVIGRKGAGKTLIDLEGSGLPAFKIADPGITDSSVIQGFTISGGTGGGIFVSKASPQILACRFKGNSRARGGAVYLANCATPVSIVGCTFDKNVADNGSSVGEGGAIYASNASISVAKSDFKSNTARFTGGAIHMSGGTATLTDCALAWNRTLSTTGGGGAIYYTTGSTADTVTIVDTVIRNNTTAGETGGGIEFMAPGGALTNMLSMDRCEVKANRCGSVSGAYGGGIRLVSIFSSPLTGPTVPLAKIDNSFIVENIAETTGTHAGQDARGGGISTAGRPDDPTVDYIGIELCNSTVAANEAICPIGGWDDNGTPEDPEDDFVWAATSLGGGISAQQHIAYVHNGIFWGNVSEKWVYGPEYAVDIGHEIGIEGTLGDLVVSWSDVQDGDIDSTSSCDMDDTGIEIDTPGTCIGTNIEADPLFLPPPAPPYHIDDTSPCYNEGGDPCGDYDIDFEDRVNIRVDMGADEWWP